MEMKMKQGLKMALRGQLSRASAVCLSHNDHTTLDHSISIYTLLPSSSQYLAVLHTFLCAFLAHVQRLCTKVAITLHSSMKC